MADTRIGRNLKSQENQGLELLSPTSNRFPVPDDYGQVRALVSLAGTNPCTLKSLDLHTINHWRQSGGSPARYLISNRTIDVRPFVAGDYELFYWQRPDMASLPGDQSNAVSEAWPSVYVYALLIELAVWAQDLENLQVYNEAFKAEVLEINKEAKRASGDKPAMRRA